MSDLGCLYFRFFLISYFSAITEFEVNGAPDHKNIDGSGPA